jgi:hypothetical protein
MPNAVFLSLLGWKQMESYGFFTMNRERLIGRIYGRSSTSFFNVLLYVTGRMDTGRAVRNREYQLDETRLDKEQIVNLSITYCKTIVN